MDREQINAIPTLPIQDEGSFSLGDNGELRDSIYLHADTDTAEAAMSAMEEIPPLPLEPLFLDLAGSSCPFWARGARGDEVLPPKIAAALLTTRGLHESSTEAIVWIWDGSVARAMEGVLCWNPTSPLRIAGLGHDLKDHPPAATSGGERPDDVQALDDLAVVLHERMFAQAL